MNDDPAPGPAKGPGTPPGEGLPGAEWIGPAVDPPADPVPPPAPGIDPGMMRLIGEFESVRRRDLPTVLAELAGSVPLGTEITIKIRTPRP